MSFDLLNFLKILQSNAFPYEPSEEFCKNIYVEWMDSPQIHRICND